MSSFFMLLLVAALVLWVALIYNGLTARRNLARAAWADVDVQLKKRFDLIPNLASVCREYARYEADTLATTVRHRAANLADIDSAAASEESISHNVQKLIAVVEQYPNLKADKAFKQLHDALVDVETGIEFARRFFNGAVRDFNTYAASFPQLLVAKPFRFSPIHFFQITIASQREAPQVADQLTAR